MAIDRHLGYLTHDVHRPRNEKSWLNAVDDCEGFRRSMSFVCPSMWKLQSSLLCLAIYPGKIQDSTRIFEV